MTAALSAEQRAAILAQLGDAQPATDGLLVSFGKSIADRRDHSHPQWEDLFCMNLSAYMGERAAPVIRRLLDAESRAERYRIAWRGARTRALATGSAADRYSARSRELQTALQDMLGSLLGMQMERDAAAEVLALATVLEIPWAGRSAMQLRRSHGHADRWAICDRTGRRWYPDGWMYEPADDRLCDAGRFTLAEAVPLARKLAEGGERP